MGDMVQRRLCYWLWRLRRWNARQNCIAAHRHHEEDMQVRGVDGSRLLWCPACSSTTWVD